MTVVTPGPGMDVRGESAEHQARAAEAKKKRLQELALVFLVSLVRFAENGVLPWIWVKWRKGGADE